jgi:hypothetical protein
MIRDPEPCNQCKIQIREVVGSGTLPLDIYMIGQTVKEIRCKCNVPTVSKAEQIQQKKIFNLVSH